MITRLDYTLSLVIGACIGILLIPILFILDIVFPYRIVLLLTVPVVTICSGIWFGGVLQKYFGVGARFSKYAASGLLSFMIDFTTLNALSYYTGVTAGLTVGWINVPGFMFGITNAYFWNKLWVFQKKVESRLFAHLPKFLFVAIIGIIINSSIVIFMSTNISPPSAMTAKRWLNIAKIVASGMAILWNFFGYKFIAFKE